MVSYVNPPNILVQLHAEQINFQVQEFSSGNSGCSSDFMGSVCPELDFSSFLLLTLLCLPCRLNGQLSVCFFFFFSSLLQFDQGECASLTL